MVDVLKILVPLREGYSDEGKTIRMNQCFANRNEEDEISFGRGAQSTTQGSIFNS